MMTQSEVKKMFVEKWKSRDVNYQHYNQPNNKEKSMPTKEQFAAYRKVQDSGKYNMLMDASLAAIEAGLDMETYKLCILNYEALRLKYA